MASEEHAYRVVDTRICLEQSLSGVLRAYRWLLIEMPADDIATECTGSPAWVRNVPIDLAECCEEMLYLGAPVPVDRAGTVIELLDGGE